VHARITNVPNVEALRPSYAVTPPARRSFSETALSLVVTSGGVFDGLAPGPSNAEMALQVEGSSRVSVSVTFETIPYILGT